MCSSRDAHTDTLTKLAKLNERHDRSWKLLVSIIWIQNVYTNIDSLLFFWVVCLFVFFYLGFLNLLTSFKCDMRLNNRRAILNKMLFESTKLSLNRVILTTSSPKESFIWIWILDHWCTGGLNSKISNLSDKIWSFSTEELFLTIFVFLFYFYC